MPEPIVCDFCKRTLWSDRYFVQLPDRRTLILCSHAIEKIHEVLHEVNGTRFESNAEMLATAG